VPAAARGSGRAAIGRQRRRLPAGNARAGSCHGPTGRPSVAAPQRGRPPRACAVSRPRRREGGSRPRGGAAHPYNPAPLSALQDRHRAARTLGARADPGTGPQHPAGTTATGPCHQPSAAPRGLVAPTRRSRTSLQPRAPIGRCRTAIEPLGPPVRPCCCSPRLTPSCGPTSGRSGPTRCPTGRCGDSPGVCAGRGRRGRGRSRRTRRRGRRSGLPAGAFRRPWPVW
jgi:hypothetical protein